MITCPDEIRRVRPKSDDEWSGIEDDEWSGIEDFLLYLKHLKAYDFARELCRDKIVLDIGCGSGYGPRLIAQNAREVVAVDIDEMAIQYCRNHYSAPNLMFTKIAPGFPLPFEAGTFDVVTAFQVIEHIQPNYVRDFCLDVRRILKNGGQFLLTTPNRKLRLLPFQRPWNKEHYKEYTGRTLYKVLRKSFTDVKIKGLRATHTIEAIEMQRVKQDPFIVYFVVPYVACFGGMYHAIKPFLPIWCVNTISLFWGMVLGRRRRKRHHELEQQDNSGKGFTGQFSLDDFFFTEKGINRSLDLVGICRKV